MESLRHTLRVTSISNDPYAVFDFGGTNLRGGTFDPSTGRTTLLHVVEVPAPPTADEISDPNHSTAEERVESALDELFDAVSAIVGRSGLRARAVSVSSRGAFRKVHGSTWWVPRSLGTMEHSPEVIEKAVQVVRQTQPELTDDREIAANALVVPMFPLEDVLTRLTKSHFRLEQVVPILQDSAANLVAEAAEATRAGTLKPGVRPALLIVGTGIGFVALDEHGRPILDENGQGPGISRLAVDESGLTLTGATNGPALLAKFGRLASDGDAEMIDHAAGHLAPIVARHMAAGDGPQHLIVTGGVALGLGRAFCAAMEVGLRDQGLETTVEPGRHGDTVGLTGAGIYATTVGLTATPL